MTGTRHGRLRQGFAISLLVPLLLSAHALSTHDARGQELPTMAAPQSLPAGATLEGATDVTAERASTRSLLAVLKDGGPILIPIAGCSFLLCIFVFERAICLRRGRVIPRPFVKRFIHQLQQEELPQFEALRLCLENKSPVAEVFAAAVKKWGRPSVEVEQAVLDTGERVANRLRKYLRLFHGISTVSPLLGLLGTVLGMISCFNAVATSDAMGRPELLAAGISQALITTATGLSVAIPALIAHLYFVGRVDRLVMEIDALSQDVVNAIASDGWREPSEKKTAKPSRGKAA
jgi:biopolymer transport protein ExbB